MHGDDAFDPALLSGPRPDGCGWFLAPVCDAFRVKSLSG